MAEVEESVARAEVESLPRPNVFDGIRTAPPAGLESTVGVIADRLTAIETGILTIVATGDPDLFVPIEIRTRFQLAILQLGIGNTEAVGDLPPDPIPAARTFLRQISPKDVDRFLTAAFGVLMTFRLAAAQAEIAELRIDLAAAQADSPEVQL